MKYTTTSNLASRPVSDLLVLPFYQKVGKADPAFSLPIEEHIANALSSGDFLGKLGDMLLLYPDAKTEKRILLLGLGEKKKEMQKSLREAGGILATFCRQKKIKKAVIALESLVFAEGLLLGTYTFDLLKKESIEKEPPVLLEEVVFASKNASFNRALKKLIVIAQAVNTTRDLVNGNADDVNADTLSAFAKNMAKEHKAFKVSVLRKEMLEKEKMGLMLAVNRGSIREPALILIEYKGTPNKKESLALIGKGVTYDTGGLNLKPTGSMETMKCDMAGAATVLGIMQAAVELKLKINLIAVLAVVENAIGPASFKPGDVYASRSGKTVEIGNTDAEGRLILADAMTYVQDHYQPSTMIDFATLTGGIVVALGDDYTGLFCNNDTLAKLLIASGEKTGDRLWRMPLDASYHAMLKSKIADLKNISGGRKASSCTAAAFLEEFVQTTKGEKETPCPWAHLDIAGTAFLDEPKGWNATQATGVCVRMIIDFIEQL